MEITGTRRGWALRWLSLVGAGAASIEAQSRGGARAVRFSNPAGLSKPTGYSHVAEVMSGRTVYIAGQVALDKDGQLVGRDDFAAQIRQVFTNLNTALASAGAVFGDVVKLNYYVVERVDRAQIAVLRETRDRFVNTQSPPVSTLVYVKDLARADFLVEVEAIAVVRA